MRVQSKRVLAISMAVFMVFSLAAGVVRPEVASAASNFVVNSTADTSDLTPGDDTCDDGTGACTLRAAIEEANANANPGEQDTISFGLTGTADFTNSGQDGYTFSPASSYPDIAEPLVIDGYSQANAQPNSSAMGSALDTRLLVEVTSSGPNIFSVSSDDVTIRGLVLNGASDQGGAGIGVSSADNTQIYGNFIGVDPTGMIAQPNFAGIVLNAGTATRIGSGSPADVNLISGSSPAQILVFQATSARIDGNVIGPTSTLDTSAGLSPSGGGIIFVGFNSGSDNIVGSTSGQPSNIIAGMGAGIISIGGDQHIPTRNSFLGNSIYDNAGFGGGIDLMSDTDADTQPDADFGININDPGDVDTGTNDYLNTPVIHTAVYDSAVSQLFVHFDLDVAGSPSDSYRVEFFANDTSDPGQGKTLIGTRSFSAGLDQAYAIQPNNSYDPTGKYITATVTQQDGSFSNQGFGSTSEFSEPTAVTVGQLDLDMTKTLTNPNDIRAGGTANYDLTITNNGQVPVALDDNGDQNTQFGVYDVSAPNLSFISASGEHIGGCQQIPDQEAGQFLGQAAINHTNHNLLGCSPSSTGVLLPGESTTFTLQFTVDSVPTGGFANYAFLLSFGDPDFFAMADLANNAPPGTLDIFDLVENGDLVNGNVAIARYTPPSSAKLAASGQTIVRDTALSLLLVVPLAGLARRRQHITFRHLR